jgi:predicted phage terminase large subunit-like protein
LPEISSQEKAEIYRSRAKRDKFYLSKLLGYDFCEDVQTDLFDQYVPFDGGKSLFDQHHIKDRLTLWSRGFFKTTSIIVEAVQLILCFPDVSIMLMQSTQKNTKGLLKEVKSHFDGSNPNSKLDSLFPEFCLPKLGTATDFTVPARTRTRKDPTVFIASPKSVKAGLHPDVGFFDDLVNEVNYKNPELMKQVIDDFALYVPLINPGGYRYVTGTRYTFGDLYEHIMRTNEGQWQITRRDCWVRKPDGSKESLFPPRRLPDGRTIGISVEMLLAIQKKDPEMFAAQYENQPIASGRQLFPESLILGAVRAKNPNLEAGPAVLFVDLASSLDADADKSVVVCGRQVQGCPTVCDLRSGQWSTLQIAQTIIEMALLHRPLKVLIEGSQGSSYFIDYLRMIAKDKGIFLSIEPIKVSNQKAAKHLRISAIEGAIKTNRLRFLAGLPQWAEVVQQFTRYPKDRHDDAIDTIGLMVQFYSGQIALYQAPVPSNLPFFLRTPGVDYGLESQIVNPADSEALYMIPEAIF